MRMPHVSLPVILSREASASSVYNMHIEDRLFTLFESAMVSYLAAVAAGVMSLKVPWGRKLLATFFALAKRSMVLLMTT